MSKGNTVANYIRNGIGDMAYDHFKMWQDQGEVGNDDLDKLKAAGCTDIAGAYADDMFNDKFLIADMMGDRVHDACCGNEQQMRTTYDELRTEEGRQNKAWHEAIDMLEERWQ